MSDYSKTIFSKGIVCVNTNNFSKCVVIDGEKGSETDRESLVLELFSKGLSTHTPPNRALIPTGEYIDISKIENMLRLAKEERERYIGGKNE